LKAAESDEATPEEKAEMLMEIASGLQMRPKTPEQLEQAIGLYRRALDLCPSAAPLLRARITARLGTAQQARPGGGNAALHEARRCYDAAYPVLKESGKPEEVAELDMNLGLVQQALSASGAARLHDAIQCYHRALRTFTRESFPQEFSILHNNLAIAYLSIPLSDERGKMREALAVQSFEEVLKVINLVDHPSEYAMVQNNLGNALQYASSGHSMENTLRALDAYDEALKVRNPRDTPLEYANTIANKANALRNLPDDPDRPGREGPGLDGPGREGPSLEGPGREGPSLEGPGLEGPGRDRSGHGRRASLGAAHTLYREAQRIFAALGQADHSAVVVEALTEIEREMAELPIRRTNGDGGAHAGA
jgi:tetratricopeptide (TPR) repeat protein